MSIAIITGSAGLVGSETARYFADQGLEIVGIDNDLRSYFFGAGASTKPRRGQLERELGRRYTHFEADIRNSEAINQIFSKYGGDIIAVVHAAAQPSHDWAAREPQTDFTVNANGTLNMLEATRNHCPQAAFIFTSTNKVYGDTPNRLPLVEQESRWEVNSGHPYHAHGIDEGMSIDSSLHSLFGASKAAADVLVQEYGRYFGMNTVCFRGGCLTGPHHAGAELHGFLAYLVLRAIERKPYTVFGYQGKQVRDNIHSRDLAAAFWSYTQNPRPGEVYNMGGGRHSNCSMREAIALVEKLTGEPMDWTYSESNRRGDHIWWISDTRKFKSHYPAWDYAYGIEAIIREIYEEMTARSKR